MPGLLVAGPREAGHQLRRPRAHSLKLTLTLMDKESLCAGRRGDGWQREGGGDKGAPRRSTIQPRFCVFLDGERWSRKGLRALPRQKNPRAVRSILGGLLRKYHQWHHEAMQTSATCVDCAKKTSSNTSKPLYVQAAAFIAVGANYSHVVTESR